jgi:toxin HigB-1
MEISFARTKLKKVFDSKAALVTSYGEAIARKIGARMAVLKNARSLSHVPTTKPERCHQLSEDRDEQFAVDLVHPHRLVFEPNHDPMPRKEDGGIDKERVTAITILEVVDYH